MRVKLTKNNVETMKSIQIQPYRKTFRTLSPSHVNSDAAIFGSIL